MITQINYYLYMQRRNNNDERTKKNIWENMHIYVWMGIPFIQIFLIKIACIIIFTMKGSCNRFPSKWNNWCNFCCCTLKWIDRLRNRKKINKQLITTNEVPLMGSIEKVSFKLIFLILRINWKTMNNISTRQVKFYDN